MTPASATLPVNMRVQRPDGMLGAHRRGDGPVLLLLHGWTLDRRMWLPMIDALAAEHSVIALDRRGSGESDCPADLAAEIGDIDALLDMIGAPCAHIAGMSQGGRIATRYAYLRPERTASLMLFAAPLDGAAPPPDATDSIPVARYRALCEAGRTDAALAEWLDHPLMKLDGADGDLSRLVTRMATEARFGELLGDAALAPFGVDLSAHLSAMEMPVLTVTGGKDSAYLRKISRFIADECPHGRAIEIERAGHLATLTHPAEIVDACLPFLGACSMGQATESERPHPARP